MGLTAGTRLGHYEILEPLGAGGMGEVFRAHDARLDRDVALKVLPEGALDNEEARKRFRREAHALSRLSHPHIATLLDFDTYEGTDYLAMELVRGHSLRDEIGKGALPEKTVVRLGAQLARGLQAAHEKGIVHRDLKPSNLRLTEDGLLKILDFGLARLQPREPAPGEGTAVTQTATGEVAGTRPYMSPEQLRGRGVDARTDLYAAGAVLYEMATAQRVFSRPSGAELTEAILSEEPRSPREVNDRLSPGLEAVILKALDKDPELRYQTARDLRADLERLQQRPDPASSGNGPLAATAPVSERPLTRRRVAVAAGLLLVLLAAAAATWLLRPPPPPRITNVRPLTGGLDSLVVGSLGWQSWATDGVRLYYLAAKGDRPALFQLPIAGGEPVARPLPFRRVNTIWGYLPEESALLMTGAQSESGGPQEAASVWVVPVPAGAPARVGALQTRQAALSADGRLIAIVKPNTHVIVIARRDGSIEQELGPLPTEPGYLAWGPRGRRIRYEATSPGADGHWIWEASLDTGEPHPLWPGEGGRWSGDGRYFVFARWNARENRSDLYAVREGSRLWPGAAEPVRLTSGPLSFTDPGTSPDGRHLFAFGVSQRAQVLKWDAGTERFQPYLEGLSASTVAASRDGDWLAWVSHPEGTLWRGRPDGSDRLRLTGKGWRTWKPRWSPDGQSLVFVASAPDDPRESLYLVSREGGPPELLVPNETEDDRYWDPCWEPDGSAVLFSYYVRSRRLGLHRFDLATREVSLLPGTECLHYPQCSPTGDLIAVKKPPPGSPGDLTIVFYRADRGTWEPAPNIHVGAVSFSSDGESVISLDWEAKRIVRWSRTTGETEVVAEIPDIPLTRLRGAPWMGLAPDGSPLIVRDRSARDLYALEWEAP